MIIDVETMPKETIVIWNKCSDVLPTDPDDEDKIIKMPFVTFVEP